VLSSLEQFLNEGKGARNQIQETIFEDEKKKSDLEKKYIDQDLAAAFIQKVATDTQNQVTVQTIDIVQSVLDTMFPGVYKFKMEITTKNNKNSVAFHLSKDGTLLNPAKNVGGGVADTVSFALRLAVWKLSGTDNTMLLDEPFKFLSKGLRPEMSLLLRTLSERLKLQIIMVTHDTELIDAAHRVFSVKQKQRRSIVTQIK